MSYAVLKTKERYPQTRALRHSVQLEKVCNNYIVIYSFLGNYIACYVVLDLGRNLRF